jgi:hypothetical protein
MFSSARPKVRLCGGGMGLQPLAVGASAGLPELALIAVVGSIVTRRMRDIRINSKSFENFADFCCQKVEVGN